MNTIYFNEQEFKAFCSSSELKAGSYTKHGNSYNDFFNEEDEDEVRVLWKKYPTSGYVVYASAARVEHFMDYINQNSKWFEKIERHKTLEGNYLCYDHSDQSAWYVDKDGWWLSSVEDGEGLRKVRWARRWGRDPLTLPLKWRLESRKYAEAMKIVNALEPIMGSDQKSYAIRLASR